MTNTMTRCLNKNLEIRWTKSRGIETYGWNIVTLYDGDTKYRTNGGGFDMDGTVFAMWLQANYMTDIIAKCKPIDYGLHFIDREGDYGFFTKDGKYWLDGGCGLDNIKRIAKAIGLDIEFVYARKKGLTNILIFNTGEAYQ